MPKINVLFMQSQSYFGADSMIHGLLMRYFDRQRLNVHVACNPGSNGEPSASIETLSNIPELHLLPTRFGVSINSQLKKEIVGQIASEGIPMVHDLGRLVRYARKNRIDIIHATEKPRDAFYGVLLAKLSGARCLIHLHVKVEDWISPITQWAMKQADALLGVSAFVAESAVEFGYPAEKTFSVLNSLDASGWDPALDGSQVRNEFGIGNDVPMLVVISRLFPWKGHTELLKALALVKQSTTKFKLLIVGEDDPRATPGGGSYMAQLKELTCEFDLADNVIFTGFRRDISHILAASDIFAMPTYEEPFGIVFLEAMAMKKPIIAIESGGVPELVEHGKVGLLSAYQDDAQLAMNIIKLINDQRLRQEMGESGRRKLDQYFTPQRMADEVEQVYLSVINPHTRLRTINPPT
jgi:glycosyltransferase involved in cell wall biosynthesis